MIDNFNHISLLANDNIQLVNDRNETFVFKIPTIREGNNSLFFSQFLEFCSLDINEFREKCGVKQGNRLELIKSLMATNLLICFLNGFQMTIDGFKYESNEIYCGDNVVDGIVFDRYIKFILIGCGRGNMEDFLQDKEDETNLSPEELEWRKKEKENDRRIRDLKSKSGEKTSTGIEYSLASIIYEFGFSMEELLNFNIFTINFFGAQISKLVNYDLRKRSASAGLLKKGDKFSYWINEK